VVAIAGKDRHKTRARFDDLAASERGRTEPGAKTPSSMAAALIAPTTHEYADPSTIMRHEHALLSACAEAIMSADAQVLRRDALSAGLRAGFRPLKAWNLHSGHVIGDVAALVRAIEPYQARAADGFLERARQLLAAQTVPTALAGQHDPEGLR
jgi:hypothetical protein